jgi:hypothetical protein
MQFPVSNLTSYISNIKLYKFIICFLFVLGNLVSHHKQRTWAKSVWERRDRSIPKPMREEITGI